MGGQEHDGASENNDLGHPPLIDQLRPLSTAELVRRAILMGTSIDPALATKQEALEAAVAAHASWGPRRMRSVRGIPLPPKLCSDLLVALQTLRWPTKNARPSLTSSNYFVLTRPQGGAAEHGTQHPHYVLRRLCDEVTLTLILTLTRTSAPTHTLALTLAVQQGDRLCGARL
jgi:hypothetical protein